MGRTVQSAVAHVAKRLLIDLRDPVWRFEVRTYRLPSGPSDVTNQQSADACMFRPYLLWQRLAACGIARGDSPHEVLAAIRALKLTSASPASVIQIAREKSMLLPPIAR